MNQVDQFEKKIQNMFCSLLSDDIQVRCRFCTFSGRISSFYDVCCVKGLKRVVCSAGMRTRALSLHQQGWSWTKIATELGCHRTTVMRLVHKWQQTGCIADLPHRRKPRPTQQQQHLQQTTQQQQQQQQQPQDR